MIQILAETEGNVVATRATGKLKKSDYDLILPVLQEKEKEYEKISGTLKCRIFKSGI